MRFDPPRRSPLSNELRTNGYAIVYDIVGAGAFEVPRAAATALEAMAARREHSGDGFVPEAPTWGAPNTSAAPRRAISFVFGIARSTV